MKFVLLIAVVFVLAAGAQQFHGTRSTSQQLTYLTRALHLTDTQRTEIQPLLQAHHDRIQALFDSDPTLSRADVEPQIHAISDATHHEIETLLTPSQLRIAKRLEHHRRL